MTRLFCKSPDLTRVRCNRLIGVLVTPSLAPFINLNRDTVQKTMGVQRFWDS